MKTNTLAWMVFLGLCVSCTSPKENPDSIFGNLQAPKETNPLWSQLFTPHYEITPLETASHCLVGQIDKLKKFDNHYYIACSNGKTVLHFDHRGRFVSAVNSQGQGPEEYHRVEDFDVYEVDGQTEIWISDNKSLKRYRAADGSFSRSISFPFMIHKFKRMENSHILLVTGNSDQILTLTDSVGNILSRYLDKEIPHLLFRPVQWVAYGNEFLFQLGISNSFVAFDPRTEQFRKGQFTTNPLFLSDSQQSKLFATYGTDFIFEARKSSYFNNLSFLFQTAWIQIRHENKNYLTKVEQGKAPVSTVFEYGTVLSTIAMGESNNSLLLYLTPEELEEYADKTTDKFGNKLTVHPEANPYLLEFFDSSNKNR